MIEFLAPKICTDGHSGAVKCAARPGHVFCRDELPRLSSVSIRFGGQSCEKVSTIALTKMRSTSHLASYIPALRATRVDPMLALAHT